MKRGNYKELIAFETWKTRLLKVSVLVAQNVSILYSNTNHGRLKSRFCAIAYTPSDLPIEPTYKISRDTNEGGQADLETSVVYMGAQSTAREDLQQTPARALHFDLVMLVLCTMGCRFARIV
jgi:hypothetical protein